VNFKEWFEKNNNNKKGGEIFEPVDPGEYPRSATSAKKLKWFQWRLEGAIKSGRPVYNIDSNWDWKFVTQQSRSAPTDQPWVHKADSGKSDLEVINGIDLQRIGVGEDWNKPNILDGPIVAQ
jgi:hypothetical protein